MFTWNAPQAAYSGVSYPKAVARELDEVRQEHATMVGSRCYSGRRTSSPTKITNPL